MKLIKAAILGLAVFGCFTAGVGALLKILQPLVLYIGPAAALYVVGMITLLVVIVTYLVHKSPI
jgi:hypothetical protein